MASQEGPEPEGQFQQWGRIELPRRFGQSSLLVHFLRHRPSTVGWDSRFGSRKLLRNRVFEMGLGLPWHVGGFPGRDIIQKPHEQPVWHDPNAPWFPMSATDACHTPGHCKSPSLRTNVLVNYLGQFVLAGLNIGMVPIYLRFMGREAFGLLGFFTMLCNWLQLLDLGMSGSLMRESAAFRAGALSATAFRQIIRVIDCLFLLVGIAIGVGVGLCSGVISSHWLKAESLDPIEVRVVVILMGVILALRWQTTVRRSVAIGLEKHVWLNSCSVFFALARSGGTVLLFLFYSTSPIVFFLWQVVIFGVEFGCFTIAVRGWLPVVAPQSLSFAPLVRLVGFSFSIALTNSLWIVVSQSDKLVLSNVLPLSQYASFSVAITAAGGIAILTSPIALAVQPRLVHLVAMKADEAFLALYSDVTQLISGVAFPVSCILALAARPLLLAWTGDAAVSEQAGSIVAFYAIGNACLAVSGMTFYLQFAKGELKLHILGCLLFVVILLPLIIFAAKTYGMIGAGAVWATMNIGFLTVWAGVVHRRFVPGLHIPWLARDVLVPALGTAGGGLAVLVPWDNLSRGGVMAAGALLLLAAVSLGLSLTRQGQLAIRRVIAKVASRSATGPFAL